VDFDRYLSSLFAPRALRSRLNVLYAFNHELAKTAEIVSQPIAGQIRLQWWRDRITELYAGVTVDHPLTAALGDVIAAHHLPRDLFDALIDAREHDLDEAPFATTSDFETYADATSANLMRLAARILGARDTLDQDARELGTAYAITGLCRALPYHAARRRLMLPMDRLAAAGLSAEHLFARTATDRTRTLIHDMAALARHHLHTAQGHRHPRQILPALLPAATVPLYLRALTKPRFDIYRDAAHIAVPRRQLAMVQTMIRRRV
jgi:NADH dehydrogenase [ubiquinone] 1 alpha subcomplex assembly factor 6